MPLYEPDLGQYGTWNEASLAIPTEKFLLQYQHLKLSGGRLAIAGTSEVYVTDFGTISPFIAGAPKSGSFIVPDNYTYDLLNRLSIQRTDRTTLQGSADLALTDDFRTRGRIVLAGRG